MVNLRRVPVSVALTVTSPPAVLLNPCPKPNRVERREPVEEFRNWEAKLAFRDPVLELRNCEVKAVLRDPVEELRN